MSNHCRFVVAVIAAAISASLVVSLPVRAEQISFFSTGTGKMTCASYLDASKGIEPNALQYHEQSKRIFVSSNSSYDQWIFGFLSAINLASAMNGNNRPDIQARNVEIIGWVRNWCAEHPDAPMFEGIHSYVKNQWAQKSGK